MPYVTNTITWSKLRRNENLSEIPAGGVAIKSESSLPGLSEYISHRFVSISTENAACRPTYALPSLGMGR